MKKIMFFLTILMMVFVFGGPAFPDVPVSVPGTVSKTEVITYIVKVHMFTEVDLCNSYAVTIRDENGQLVAPPKAYQHGIDKYIFTERGPKYGRRVANLFLVPIQDDYVCPTELWCAPAGLDGPFLNGATYQFDLYPTSQPPH